MEGYLRIGLLVITAAILFMMIYESRRRRPKRKELSMSSDSAEHIFETQPRTSHDFLSDNDVDIEQEPLIATPAKSTQSTTHQNLIVMSVLAKPSHAFASYDLLQALSAAGMQFGEMKIFHYYLPTLNGKVALFSLASATEPGYFDMDKIGEFSCKGLTLFMNLADVHDPEHAFEIMLDTAQQLADDLDGDLYSSQRQPWNESIFNQYHQQVIDYVQRH